MPANLKTLGRVLIRSGSRHVLSEKRERLQGRGGVQPWPGNGEE